MRVVQFFFQFGEEGEGPSRAGDKKIIMGT